MPNRSLTFLLLVLLVAALIPARGQDSWLTARSPTSANLWGVCAGAGQWVAVGENGTIVTSPDGVQWTSRASGTTRWLTGVCYGNQRFVAVGDAGTVLVSTDAATWNRGTVPDGTPRLNAVTWGFGRYVAVGEEASATETTNSFFQSFDGLVWTRVALPPNSASVHGWLRGLMTTPTGFVAVGQAGYVVEWLFNGSPQVPPLARANSLEAIVAGHDHWVAAGAGGQIWDWPGAEANAIQRSAPTSAALRGLAFANNEFVAAGDAGTVLTSDDAATWTARPSGTGQVLTALAASDTSFVAVGFAGTIVRSGFATHAPAILTPPSDTTEQLGSAPVLSVTASGSEPLTYQWLTNGVPIPGATTAQLEWTALAAVPVGTYSVAVKVSNAAGEVTSAPARVQIVASLPASVVDPSFLPTPAPSGAVRGIYPQPDGSVVITGDFSYTRPDGTVQAGIARLEASGRYDPTFNGTVPTVASTSLPTGSPNGDGTPFVASPGAVLPLPDGTTLVGGQARYAYPSAEVVRIRADGTWDPGFVFGGGGSWVQTMRRLNDGSIAVAEYGQGGSRVQVPYSATVVRRLVPQLNGWTSYHAGPISGWGPSAVLLYPDGRVVLGANFDYRTTGVLSTGAAPDSVVRYAADGSVDSDFLRGPGVDGSVYALAAAPNDGVYVGGAFATVAGVTRPRLARLNAKVQNRNPTRATLLTPSYVEVPSGGTVTLDAHLTGTAASATWSYSDGTNSNLNPFIPSSSGPRLTLSNVNGRFMGYYWLSAGGGYVYVRVVPSRPPQIQAAPVSQSVSTGRSAVLNVTLTDTTEATYQWYRNGVAISGATNAALGFDVVTPADAGTYALVATNALGSATSTATLAVVERPVLINLSVRAPVGTGDSTLILGFGVSAPSGMKPMLVRAVGPTLQDFGMAGAVPDPQLTVYDDTQQVMVANDNWQEQAGAPLQFPMTFPLAAYSRDAAAEVFARTTATMHVTGVSGASGVALAEVYETTTTGRLVNLSARAMVGSGDAVAINGFVLRGTGKSRLLVRGIGPALAAFGVGGTLANPTISLCDAAGNVLAENGDWGSRASAPGIAAASEQVGAFALADGSLDAALLVELPAGSYTAIVRGAGGTTGNALLELYEVP